MLQILKEKPIFFGSLCALLATILWSGNFIVARALNESMPPVALSFWRWFVAFVVFLPFGLKAVIYKRHTLKKHFSYLALLAFLGVSLFNTLMYIAAKSTSALNLSLISITFPVFIVFFSRFFFKETVGFNKLVGLVLVLVGILLLLSKAELRVLLELTFVEGDVWMLFAAISFAIYSMLLKKKPKELSVKEFQLSTFFLGLVFLLPFYVLEARVNEPIELSKEMVGAVLYIGVCASLFAFVLWNVAVERIGAARAGMFYYTLPLFSGFLAFVFLDEVISMVHFYSGVLILVGIFTANIVKNKSA